MSMTISREPSGPDLIQFTVRHKSDLTPHCPSEGQELWLYTPPSTHTPREKDTTVELKFYSALKTNFQVNEDTYSAKEK